MDLTFNFGEYGLNIRVSIIAKTNKGYVFEKHPMGHLYIIGGRIKINENSLGAAKRELEEELGVTNIDLRLKGILENFFTYNECKVHEISFIYEIVDEIKDINLGQEFMEIPEDEIENSNILPKILKKIITSQHEGVRNYLQESEQK